MATGDFVTHIYDVISRDDVVMFAHIGVTIANNNNCIALISFNKLYIYINAHRFIYYKLARVCNTDT